MTRLKLPDGRALSYLRRGSPSSSSVILWFHGIVSSRYECLAVKQGVLERLKAVVICVDRPGYGESSPQRDRTYQQYAQVKSQHSFTGHFVLPACLSELEVAGQPWAHSVQAVL